MAVTPITLTGLFQTWAASGLQHLLLDAPVCFVETQAEPPPGSVNVSPARMAQQKEVVPQTTQLYALQGKSQTSGAVPRPHVEEKKSAPFAHGVKASTDAGTWPRPWAVCFAKTKPASIVWTYHNLGSDMLGNAGASGRGPFFRLFIKELHLSKGSSTFWPCAVPFAEEEGDTVKACPEIFAAGLSTISPQHIIAFGEDALCDIGLPSGHIDVFRSTFVGGRQLILLPSPEGLMENDKQRAAAVSWLRALLPHFVDL